MSKNYQQASSQPAAGQPAARVITPRRIEGTVVSQVTPQTRNFFAARNQLRSVVVGGAAAVAVMLLFAFVLFNELVISPFIRPGDTTVQVPAVTQAGAPVDPSPKIRIPKISVEIPVVYGLASTDARQFELALDQGVVHYPSTVLPGQAGNAAFFAHSSNNIFNPGKYKFAFVLLHELVPGDPFYLTHGGQLYEYEVVSKQVVKPTEVGVLGAVAGQVATATLITCDPPGTSTNRLVVVGRQVNPAVADVPAPEPARAAADGTLNGGTALPGNGPGLFTRTWRSVFGQ